MYLFAAWLLIALANSEIYMIYAARAIQGFCIGVASLSLPVYLAETVQPEVRGTLGLLPTTLGNLGILICFVSGTYMTWDQLAYLGAVLSLPFLIAMLYIPETPRWYIAKGMFQFTSSRVVIASTYFINGKLSFVSRKGRRSSKSIAMVERFFN
jgi:MFS family permease